MSERKRDYPTGNPNGMSFICNRWVFTGPEGYRVRPNGDGSYNVYSYAHTSERAVALSFSENAAHELAASLARTTPHPKPTEV